MLPGAAFVNPGTPLREALTRAATLRAIEISTLGQDYRPLGLLVDERAIVNAITVLLATGGSTNHSIHWVAVARAAGIVIDWTDLSELSAITPLLVRMYPNGDADVNRFETAGGIGFVLRELLDAGLLHGAARTVFGDSLRDHARKPQMDGTGRLHWNDAPAASGEREVLRGAQDAFEPHGGLRLVQGNLGRALIKIAALKPEQRRIRAPRWCCTTSTRWRAATPTAPCRRISSRCCASRARTPTACPSCTASPRCWATCKTRAGAWRW